MKRRSSSISSWSLAALAALAALACGGGVAASPPATPRPTGPSVEPPTPAPVVAAERAFAADGLARGVKASFLAHSAGDAILIQPDPVNAHQALTEAPDPPPGSRPALEWWPRWAGIARSGDLGFTTGPFAIAGARRGHYFTIWKKQPDGAWKWVFDGGVDTDPAAEAAAGSPVEYLAPSTAASSSPEAAIAEVRALEEALARRAATDLVAAYAEVLADDGRVHTAGLPPARDRAAFAAAIAARAAAMELAPLGGGASAGADLVWTYGEASWGSGGAAGRGHVVRVWQNRAGGWRLVFDELLPRKEP